MNEQVICADPETNGEVVLSREACMGCARSRNNGCVFTAEILESMFDGVQHRGEHISASALTSSCQRQVVLQRQGDYLYDPVKLYAAWFGTAAHTDAEQHIQEGSYGEVRFWARAPGHPGQWVSCKPDLVDPAAGILIDYKTAKELPKGWNANKPWPSHADQLQVNRWIIDHAEGVGEDMPLLAGGANPSWKDPVPYKPAEWNRLEVVYLTKEGMARYPVNHSVPTMKQDGTLSKKGKIVPWVWSDDHAEEFIAAHYAELREALSSGTVPDVPGPKWEWAGHGLCMVCPVRAKCIQLQAEAAYGNKV